MHTYVAKTRLYHRPTETDIEPEQPVDLSHLSQPEIEGLISKGYVAEAEGEAEVKIEAKPGPQAVICEPFADAGVSDTGASDESVPDAPVLDVAPSDGHKKARSKKAGG